MIFSRLDESADCLSNSIIVKQYAFQEDRYTDIILNRKRREDGRPIDLPTPF